MSQIKIEANPSGGGIYTLQSGAGSTDRTITLPDKAGAIAVGAGTVVQFKEQEYTALFTTTSSTFVDAYTGFTFTPTSATNKVYIEFNGRFFTDANNTDTRFQIVRDSTVVWVGTHFFAASTTMALVTSLTAVDTPGTTSEVTYKLQGKRQSGSGNVRVVTTLDNINSPNAYLRAWEIVA